MEIIMLIGSLRCRCTSNLLMKEHGVVFLLDETPPRTTVDKNGESHVNEKLVG